MTIPEYLKHYAHDLTVLRIEENKNRYKGTHKQRTGNINSALLGYVSREYYTEYIGILSELLIRDRLDRDLLCSSYCVSTLLKKTDLASNDIDITMVRQGNETRLSIKGCEGSMKANKQAIDSEDVDSVVFVIYQDQSNCIFKSYKPKEIMKWEIKTAFSDYYYKQLR